MAFSKSVIPKRWYFKCESFKRNAGKYDIDLTKAFDSVSRQGMTKTVVYDTKNNPGPSKITAEWGKHAILILFY